MSHDESERKQQDIAEQKTVDRLPHHHRVFADIEEKQHHQLAGEQYGGARRRDDAERQRDVKYAGEIGLEEMHHPERGEEGAQPDTGARAQQRCEHHKIKKSIPGQEQHVFDFSHYPI